MKTFIVLIPVKNWKGNARAKAEIAKGITFYNQEGAERFFYSVDSYINIYEISDFMDKFNNEEIDQTQFFLTYILTKN